MRSEPPPIFIAVPVFRGWELVEETLRSIRDQEFKNFRVLISIDGADERSAEVCSKYTGDSRFEMILQPERLGWAANLNWLMARCDAEFFCYWQQDDLCATNYLAALSEGATRHPEAACVYADVQWFGGRFGREMLPSVEGPPLQRVLEQIEQGHFAPFRGLIRQSAIAGAGPLRITDFDSRLEDLVWVAKIAREGELHRNTETLYFKRVHSANAHSTGAVLPKEFTRSVWIEYGLGMLDAALPVTPSAKRLRLLDIILERLIVPRSGRWLFYDPWQDGPLNPIGFANEFVDAVIARFGPNPWAEAIRLPDPRAVLGLFDARRDSFSACASERRLISLALWEGRFRSLVEQVENGRTWHSGFAAENIAAMLLETGWSTPESWGVWTDSLSARMRLPITDGSTWRVELTGHGFVKNGGDIPRIVVARIGEKTVASWSCTANARSFVIEFEVQGANSREGLMLDLDTPNAVSPAELGLSTDTRRLGIGLISICIERR
jgi:glycosyltransferase involved in cell wall biosynthesis